MADTERLVAKIKAQADDQAARFIADAKNEASVIIQNAKSEAGERRGEIMAKTDSHIRRIKTMADAGLQLEIRRETLSNKQMLIEKAINMGYEAACSMPLEKYVELLAELICKSIETGSEEIVLSNDDKTRIGDMLVNRINTKLSASGKPSGVVLSGETRNIKAGAFIKGANHEINCSFEALVESVRNELELEVADILFS